MLIRFLYGFECLLTSLVFFRTYQRKKRFWLKFSLCSVLILVTAVIISVINKDVDGENFHIAKSTFLYFILSIPLDIFAFIGYGDNKKGNISVSLYVIIMSMLLRNTAKSIYRFILLMIGMTTNNSSIMGFHNIPNYWMIVYYMVFITINFLFYLYASLISYRSHQSANYIELIAYGVLLIINGLIGGVERKVSYLDSTIYLNVLIIDVLISTLFIFYKIFIDKFYYEQHELMIQNKLNKLRIKEVEMKANNIEIINQKSHDLRHQIRLLKDGSVVDNKWLEETEQAIDQYDSVVKTGNDIVDIILSEYKLIANNNNIKLIIVADGKLLDFMSKGDLVSFLSNIVENAIEHEMKINNVNDRLIEISLKKELGLIMFCCKNFTLEKEVKKETSKKDIDNHGYGIKSVETITKKYNGVIDIYIDNSFFNVNISFSLLNK